MIPWRERNIPYSIISYLDLSGPILALTMLCMQPALYQGQNGLDGDILPWHVEILTFGVYIDTTWW